MNPNLYCALRQAFPADLDSTAIECCAPDGGTGPSLFYTWRDLDHGSARIANLLASLDLPVGARVLVQTDKSVEALILYLAVLRAGLVYVPLNSAYQASELAYFIGNAAPSVVVCAPRDFGWLSKLAFCAGVTHVYTLDDQRGGTLLQRAVPHPDTQLPAQRAANDVASIIYTSGTTGRSKGAMLSHGNLLSNAQLLKTAWGWRSAAEGGDVLIGEIGKFKEAGACCTAAVITPIGGIQYNGKLHVFHSETEVGPVTQKLYAELTGIQSGDVEAPAGWIVKVA